MNQIYTVTAIGFTNTANKQHRSRVWGWYEHYYDAVEATIENYTDMNEAGYYPYIVIEEVKPGILPLTKQDKQTWYEFDNDDKKYHKTEQPKEFKNIVNWSIG